MSLPQIKRNTFLFPLILLLILVVVTFAYNKLLKKNPPSNANPNTKLLSKFDLSKGNLLIHTRCYETNTPSSSYYRDFLPEKIYNGSYPEECLLFGRNLPDLESETLIDTFSYDNEDPGGNYGGIKLEGFIDNYIVYSENYYDKDDSEYSHKNRMVLGILDLKTGNKIKIEEMGSYKAKNENGVSGEAFLLKVLPDTTSKKIYYQTQTKNWPNNNYSGSNISTDNRVKEYDLVTKQTRVIADNKVLGSTYDALRIKSVLKDGIFVSGFPICRVPKMGRMSFSDGTLNDFPNVNGNLIDLEINDRGDKMTYVTSEKASGTGDILKLKVASIDGTNEKVVYTIPNTHLEGGPCSRSQEFSDFSLSPEGTMLLFKIENSDSAKEDVNYVWKLNEYQDSGVYKLDGDDYLSDYFRGWVGTGKLGNSAARSEFIYCPYTLICYTTSLNFDETKKTVEYIHTDALALHAKSILFIP